MLLRDLRGSSQIVFERRIVVLPASREALTNVGEETRRGWVRYTQDAFQDLHFPLGGTVFVENDLLFKDFGLV